MRHAQRFDVVALLANPMSDERMLYQYATAMFLGASALCFSPGNSTHCNCGLRNAALVKNSTVADLRTRKLRKQHGVRANEIPSRNRDHVGTCAGDAEGRDSVCALLAKYKGHASALGWGLLPLQREARPDGAEARRGVQ